MSGNTDLDECLQAALDIARKAGKVWMSVTHCNIIICYTFSFKYHRTYSPRLLERPPSRLWRWRQRRRPQTWSQKLTSKWRSSFCRSWSKSFPHTSTKLAYPIIIHVVGVAILNVVLQYRSYFIIITGPFLNNPSPVCVCYVHWIDIVPLCHFFVFYTNCS